MSHSGCHRRCVNARAMLRLGFFCSVLLVLFPRAHAHNQKRAKLIKNAETKNAETRMRRDPSFGEKNALSNIRIGKLTLIETSHHKTQK